MGLKRLLKRRSSGAEEVAEKSPLWQLEIPSVAKATLRIGRSAAGLKPRPFKTATFSASSEARLAAGLKFPPFQDSYYFGIR